MSELYGVVMLTSLIIIVLLVAAWLPGFLKVIFMGALLLPIVEALSQ